MQGQVENMVGEWGRARQQSQDVAIIGILNLNLGPDSTPPLVVPVLAVRCRIGHFSSDLILSWSPVVPFVRRGPGQGMKLKAMATVPETATASAGRE